MRVGVGVMVQVDEGRGDGGDVYVEGSGGLG